MFFMQDFKSFRNQLLRVDNVQNYKFFINFTLQSTTTLMETVLTKKFFLSAGDGSARHEMPAPLFVERCIEIATEHANLLGIGNPNMKEINAGWVLARFIMKINKYPEVDSNYKISTWIEDFNNHYSIRYFELFDDENRSLGVAKSVWMVIEKESHKNIGLSNLHIESSLILPHDSRLPELKQSKFIYRNNDGQIKFDFNGEALDIVDTGYYRFVYTDLDSYRHVNTVKYIDVLMNQFSLAEHDRFIIEEMELAFHHEAFFATEAEIIRATAKNDILSPIFLVKEKDADKPIFFARLGIKESKII